MGCGVMVRYPFTFLMILLEEDARHLPSLIVALHFQSAEYPTVSRQVIQP